MSFTPAPIALVTGAGQRLGRAIAVAMAGAGYDIIVHYNSSEEGATETVERIAELGRDAIPIQGDLSDPQTTELFLEEAHAMHGQLDAVVNSAAVWRPRPLAEVTVEDWDLTHAVNLRAPFFISVRAAEVLPPGGVIINIADHLATESSPGLVPHSISKAGVIAMTQHLARRFAPKIRVNAVSPGAVLPPADWGAAAEERFVASTPLGRLGSPDDVTDAVLYLVRARFVTGVVIPVDGGRHLGR
jgi:pteridine reductase